MTVAGNDREGLSARDGPSIVIIGLEVSSGGGQPPSALDINIVV